jgi:hypothetical protein
MKCTKQKEEKREKKMIRSPITVIGKRLESLDVRTHDELNSNGDKRKETVII